MVAEFVSAVETVSVAIVSFVVAQSMTSDPSQHLATMPYMITAPAQNVSG